MSSELKKNISSVLDATHLISNGIGSRPGKLVSTVVVKPRDQLRISLGQFTPGDMLKGFSIEITPEPDPPGAVVTQITNIGTSSTSSTSSTSRLTLHIANFGDKAISAEVRQL